MVRFLKLIELISIISTIRDCQGYQASQYLSKSPDFVEVCDRWNTTLPCFDALLARCTLLDAH